MDLIIEDIQKKYSACPGLEEYLGACLSLKSPIQDQIDGFMELKSRGIHFNEILMNNKEFRNPAIYTKLVEYADLDEFASNLPMAMGAFPSDAYYDRSRGIQKRNHELKK